MVKNKRHRKQVFPPGKAKPESERKSVQLERIIWTLGDGSEKKTQGPSVSLRES